MSEIERLKVNIKRNTKLIESMRQAHKDRNCMYKLSDLLCDITMSEIRLEESKQRLIDLQTKE